MSKLENREIRNLLLGRYLGRGVSREVYALRHDPSLVIKIETKSKSFANVGEWDIWQFVQGTSIEKWFAPCVDISPCGLVLLQKRVEPVRLSEMPKKIPHMFTDLKIENWGKLNGRLVCIDYGSIICKLSDRLVTAKWWRQEDR